MRQGSHAETPTVATVVRRAVAVCDPDGDNPPSEIVIWLQDAGVAV